VHQLQPTAACVCGTSSQTAIPGSSPPVRACHVHLLPTQVPILIRDLLHCTKEDVCLSLIACLLYPNASQEFGTKKFSSHARGACWDTIRLQRTKFDVDPVSIRPFCARSIAQPWHNCITNSTQHSPRQTRKVRRESPSALTPSP
jgi:hypothetical protein